MHLTNFALHTVAARTRRQADPRMRSLSSVERLQVRGGSLLSNGDVSVIPCTELLDAAGLYVRPYTFRCWTLGQLSTLSAAFQLF